MSPPPPSPRLVFPPSPFGRLAAVSDYESPRIRLAVHAPRREIYLTRVVGHVDRSAAERIVDALLRPIAAGVAPSVWHDWDRVTSCDGDACRLFLDFMRAEKAALRHVAVLSYTEPVSAEIAIVEKGAAHLGVPIVRHVDRARFESALLEALETP